MDRDISDQVQELAGGQIATVCIHEVHEELPGLQMNANKRELKFCINCIVKQSGNQVFDF